ncbi:MAG: low molecular weight protein-tyrosine-phosphatase [Succinivibrio sp.]
MLKVLFICHGNICRSPMAEFVMKAFVDRIGMSDCFEISSAATSQEEIGNSVYPPVKKLLSEHGIDCSLKHARQVTAHDLKDYDIVIAMEQYNLTNLYNLFPNTDKSKVYLLKDFTSAPGDIDDPWYTRDFKKTFNEVEECVRALITSLNADRLIRLDDKQLDLLEKPV